MINAWEILGQWVGWEKGLGWLGCKMGGWLDE